MKTVKFTSDQKYSHTENKALVNTFRLEMLKKVEMAFNEVLDSDGLLKSEQVNILENLTTIDGLLRQDKINFSELAREAHEVAFNAYALLKDERNIVIARRLQLFDLECETFLRGSENTSNDESEHIDHNEKILAYA